MATQTATTAAPGRAAAGRPRVSAGQLWQAPVFVLGVMALLGVWLARPLVPDNPLRHLDRDLATARQALRRHDGDAEHAALLAHRALDLAEQFPGRAGEAAFLLGSAHLRLAERAAGTQAADHWQAARQYLLQAEQHGVSEEDRVRLQYRLGKAGFYSADDPRRVVERLASTADRAEDQAEAYTLLTQAYLRLQPPDVKGALKANETLLSSVPLIGEDVLAPARLLRGELLLRQKEHAQARKVLERIGDQAPPAVRAQARLLRARSYLAESRWAEAANLLQEARADREAQPPDPARLLYDLGLCYRRLDQPREAARAWDECVRSARGEEGPAAALALAELRLQDQKLEPALTLLGKAVQPVQAARDWSNSLVSLEQARAAFEQGVRACREAGRHDLALRLAGLYERLAVPGRAALLRAEAAAAGAQAHGEKARRAKTNDEQMHAELAGRTLCLQAAAAYAEAAGLAKEPAARAKLLWQSAAQYLACQEDARAAEQLGRFLTLGPKVERQGEGWYLLAEAHRRLGHADAAATAYKECIKRPSPFAYRARYRLALALIARGDLDEAEAALSRNLYLLRFDPDAEAQEQSLLALGDLLYRRRNYRGAYRPLEEALGRFATRPEATSAYGPATPAARRGGPEMTRARYQLADCYRQLAAQDYQNSLIGGNMSEAAKQHFLREHKRWLEKAADEFADLAHLLETGAARGHLPPDLLLQMPFIAAQCYFDAGQYETALRLYEQLAQRNPDGLVGIHALFGIARYHASAKRGDRDKYPQLLAEMKRILPSVPEGNRQEWARWLELAAGRIQGQAVRDRPPASTSPDAAGPATRGGT